MAVQLLDLSHTPIQAPVIDRPADRLYYTLHFKQEGDISMMRRFTVMRSLLLVLVVVTAACGSSSTSSAPSSSVKVSPPTSLITAGRLTDCVDIEYSPMEYFASTSVTDPNQSIGFDVDGARAVAKAFGLQLQIRNVGFDALIPDLTAGRCDIVWTALYISQKRLAVADAVPYMATGQVVMVTKGNPKGIKSLDDLCGKKVSIQTGGVVEQRINAQSKACTDAGKPAIQIAGYPKVADEFQQIVVGRVDAVWETDTAVSDFMLKNQGQYQVGYAFPKTDTYGVYFQKNKPDLQTALTKALQALKGDSTLASLAQKYQIDPVTLDAIK
jgi:polar amino acid transport system substrate-binding protein